jgi:ribonuclease HI
LQLIDAPKHALKLKKKSMVFHEVSFSTTSIWKKKIDGASSKDVVGAGVVFVSPAQESISLSYKLGFEATNNVEEYEALVLGLRAAKDMGIKEIVVFGYAELIVNQIRNIYQAKHPRLKTYRNEVWDQIDISFLAFNTSFILREENRVVDSLAVSARNFKVPLPPKFRYDIEVKYRPSKPDNVKHWKVFEDDLEIKRFLETVDEFSKSHIDQDPDFDMDPHVGVFLNRIANHHIVKLPSNDILKGLIPLERIFDSNDVALKVKRLDEDVDVAKCNIGTEHDPKFIKLSSSLSREQRAEYTEILK